MILRTLDGLEFDDGKPDPGGRALIRPLMAWDKSGNMQRLTDRTYERTRDDRGRVVWQEKLDPTYPILLAARLRGALVDSTDQPKRRRTTITNPYRSQPNWVTDIEAVARELEIKHGVKPSDPPPPAGPPVTP